MLHSRTRIGIRGDILNLPDIRAQELIGKGLVEEIAVKSTPKSKFKDKIEDKE